MSTQTQKVMQGIRRNPVPSACGLVAIALFLTLYFRSDAADEGQAMLDSGNQEYLSLKGNLAASVRLDDEVKRLADFNKRVEAGLLRSGELARNQQFFYKIEADTGVKLVDLRQQPLGPPANIAPAKGKGASAKNGLQNPYVLLGFTITLEGDYVKTLLFMRHLEQASVLSKIATLSSSAIDGGGITMTINLQVLALR